MPARPLEVPPVTEMYRGQILYHYYMRPKRITTRKLAEMIGCSQATVLGWINGYLAISYGFGHHLSLIFGRPPEYWSDPEQQSQKYKITLEKNRRKYLQKRGQEQ